jgi:hypothetical protein
MARAMASPLRVKNTAYFDIAAIPPPTDTWDSCIARLLEAMRPPLDRQGTRARCWLPRSGSAGSTAPGHEPGSPSGSLACAGARCKANPQVESLQEQADGRAFRQPTCGRSRLTRTPRTTWRLTVGTVGCVPCFIKHGQPPPAGWPPREPSVFSPRGPQYAAQPQAAAGGRLVGGLDPGQRAGDPF